MNDNSNPGAGPADAFVKMWTESFSKLSQAAWSFSPESAPPEMMRQIRTSLFQALAQSWDELLRSPQFLEGMKQTMDNAIAFRKMSTEFFTKARHNFAGTAQEDADGLMQAVRRLETTLTARLDELTQRVQELGARVEKGASSQAAPAGKASHGTPARRQAKSRKLSSRKPPTASKANAHS